MFRGSSPLNQTALSAKAPYLKTTLPQDRDVNALPRRKRLIHDVPSWVPEDSIFFITVNCLPRGQNHLADPKTAAALTEGITMRVERKQWWPLVVLLMPDHVHGLIAFPLGEAMPKIIRDWKRYTARSQGIRWQRHFFDHRIRKEESLEEKWNYIVQNPVRAGLVKSPEDWPYIWTG
jgi:putative transposase